MADYFVESNYGTPSYDVFRRRFNCPECRGLGYIKRPVWEDSPDLLEDMDIASYARSRLRRPSASDAKARGAL